MSTTQRLRIYQHPAHAQHEPPSGHAESPQRWQAIQQALQSIQQDNHKNHQETALEIISSPLASDEQIQTLHPASYWQSIKQHEPGKGQAAVQLDPDTWLSHGSIEASARAAGAVIDGLHYTWKGLGKVFCAARPPGHHAGLSTPMGFCLINPIAIATHYAVTKLGAQRVAIVDFDVHHGNGTQDIFANNPNVLYASSHQSPLYPGTGRIDETGVGNLINRPIPAGTNSAQFRSLWENDILPKVAEFQPEALFISAGFDAHEDDPLAQLALTTDDYYWLGHQLAQFSDTYCHGRCVAMTEGGYDLDALTKSVIAFIKGMIGQLTVNIARTSS